MNEEESEQGAALRSPLPPQQIARQIYSYAEADRLAGATKGTTHRWIDGYYYNRSGDRKFSPPITAGTGGEQAASFVDLVEVVVISRLKKAGFSTNEIRQIVVNCREVTGMARPLAMSRFKAGGKQLFLQIGTSLIEVHRKKFMVAWDEVLGPFLEELEYAEDWANRWWPLGKQSPILVDPAYGFGLPVIAGSGVKTETVLERYRAGDLPDAIAADFNIKEVEVNRAIQFELTRAA